MAETRDWKNTMVLSVCQMLFITGQSLMFTVAPLVGAALAFTPILSTLPISLMLLGSLAGSSLAPLYMRTRGRKAGFMTGALLGAAGGAFCVAGISLNSFSLFCLGTATFGVFSGFSQNYRFAAADTAPKAFRGKAISLVLAGGVVAAFLGPELAGIGRDMIGSTAFVGTYVFVIVATVLTFFIVMALDIPKLTREQVAERGRPIREIMAQPVFIVATLSAAISYAAMNLLMTAAPLAIQGAAHPFGDVVWVIEWHVFAMFAPGFFTGNLIKRFGSLRVIAAGLGLFALSVAVGVAGETPWHFWVSLFALGVGWNFSFTGSTALLTTVYDISEREKTQAATNFFVFGTLVISSLSSGAIYHLMGWNWVALAILPLILVSFVATLWLARRKAAAA